MNVDIFACINFRGFVKMGNFLCIKFAFSVHQALKAIINVIFTVYIFSRLFNRRELRENMYSAKISTFTVYMICMCK